MIIAENLRAMMIVRLVCRVSGYRLCHAHPSESLIKCAEIWSLDNAYMIVKCKF